MTEEDRLMPCRYCARPMLATWPHPYCSKLCTDRHAWYGGVPNDVRIAGHRRADRAVRQTADVEQVSA